jgi:hypothetical protein
VVVYLRSLYYPEGFAFPLKMMSKEHIAVELMREAATVVMLASVGAIAGKHFWERFGFFLVAFGVWDIFYYVWLKVIVNWPATITDWDILFLIPLPWIAPVIAPVALALCMILCGVMIVMRLARNMYFRPVLLSWILTICATLVALFSFMSDLPASLHGHAPSAYRYELLVASLVLYGAGFITSCTSPARAH